MSLGKTSNGAPRRHHFVPQGHLRRFCIESGVSRNHIWVYDKKHEQPVVPSKPRAIKSIGALEGYYDVPGENGENDVSLETEYLQKIDDYMPKVVRKIENMTNIQLSEEEKANFSFCISLLLARNPSVRDDVESMFKWAAERTAKIVKTLSPMGFTLEEHLRKGDLKVEVKKFVSIPAMFQFATAIAENIFCMPWVFHSSQDVHFLTGDNPVVISSTDIYVGPAHPSCEFIFPMTRQLCLVCSNSNTYPDDMTLINADPSYVKKINLAVAWAAKSQIYCDTQSKEIAELVHRFRKQRQGIQLLS